ncbi:MAG TPA: SpoIIE family protein phosphatase [Mycobacteriales bacterium]|nr:SpoIIE family protein phosphatase [Mycobacteriales bacterium]
MTVIHDAGEATVVLPVTERTEMRLDDHPAMARVARAFVERETVARGAAEVVDDVALIAGELIANAMQHGAPPIVVSVSGDPTLIRIEVRDANPRPPVRPTASASNMTGRGLSLITALAAGWGVERAEGGGKLVWAEVSATRDPIEAEARGLDVDVLLAGWPDAANLDEEGRHTVVLGDVPTDLLIDAKSHIDNLVREFSLAATGAELGIEAPDYLVRLIQTVVHGFAEARDAIKRQALAASRRGEVRTRLVLDLPASAADAGEAYLAALDEADAYARAARLLTLETPHAHRLFRRWYVDEVVRQLRAIAAGREPAPVVGFEVRMLQEIHRLATLQRITDRAARLQRVTAALAGARTPEDVARVVVSEGVIALGAAGGGLLVPADDSEHIAVSGAVGYGEELVGALRDERIDAPLPAATALRTGEAVWLESREEADRRYPSLRGMEATTVSMCAVPLRAGGRVLGALRFSFTVRRLFDDDERAFVMALAAQTAQTLLRTETYAAERQAALNLQRALLPDDTAAVLGWTVAAHYSPAGGEEAGGDFYDVIPLSDGRTVAVVGDVMGRGVEAAAAMAQTRTMIRAYAVDDPDPLSVLAKVDHYFQVLEGAQFVTALYLLLDNGTGAVTIATAGHLPPILVRAGGCELAATVVGTPLGITNQPREVTTVQVPCGAGLVAFTDGLVERRGFDIDAGIGEILSSLRDAVGIADASTLLQRVVASAPSGGQDDDVTVLALHRR